MEPTTFMQSAKCTPWTLIKAYWQSKHRLPAYLFFGIILTLTMSLVVLDVVFNYWYNYFYDALQAYDRHGIMKLIIVFGVIAAFYITIAVYRYYLSQLFSVKWRTWLTEQFVGRWLQKRGYYYLETFDDKTDNPDQRIQEDIAALVQYSIDLSMGLISSITTFLAFIYILWELSGEMTIPLGNFGDLHIYGYLVWVCVIYAFFGTYYTLKIGKPLINLNFEQQKREATMRFAAVDLRSHSEHIALYHGEDYENRLIIRLYNRVVKNWYLLIGRQKKLLWFTAGYNQSAIILPLIFALPNYLDKIFLLGGLMQSISAYGKVQDSLSYIVNSYTNIAQWQAVTARLTTFVSHLNESEHQAENGEHIQRIEHAAKRIDIKNLTIFTPKKEKILKQINLSFAAGESYLIKGSSGLGKSTFIRCIAGIWPYAKGEIIFPKNESIMFLSQKPFIPIGNLADAIVFPGKGRDKSTEIKNALKACHLNHLIKDLNKTSNWADKLSPGEQQRIAFARLLIQKPDWIFMDESTAMVDLENEIHLYTIIRERLPKATIISVGHRSSLDKLHDHLIDFSQFKA